MHFIDYINKINMDIYTWKMIIVECIILFQMLQDQCSFHLFFFIYDFLLWIFVCFIVFVLIIIIIVQLYWCYGGNFHIVYLFGACKATVGHCVLINSFCLWFMTKEGRIQKWCMVVKWQRKEPIRNAIHFFLK